MAGGRVGAGCSPLAHGIDIALADSLGAYLMALPWERYYTGVSGYKESNKAALIIKNGWLVAEYYNEASARNAVYYLASNGKTFAMMLLGRMQLDSGAGDQSRRQAVRSALAVARVSAE